MKSHLFFAASLLLAGSIAFADSKNLLPEPGMEGAPVKGLPTGWEKAGVGADKSKFAIDTEVKHEGNQSVRIASADSTRAYVRSIEPIPVAPGEKISGSFWVKCKDVPLEPGAIIAIADFSNSDDKGNEETVAKFDTAKIAAANKGWYHITGS